MLCVCAPIMFHKVLPGAPLLPCPRPCCGLQVAQDLYSDIFGEDFDRVVPGEGGEACRGARKLHAWVVWEAAAATHHRLTLCLPRLQCTTPTRRTACS